MSVSERYDHHAKLVANMADTLGVDLLERMQRGELDGEDLRQMVHKCTGCTSPCDCANWLDANAQGSEVAPSYCRNADTFEQMKGQGFGALPAKGKGMNKLENVVSDRGSKYAVTGGPARNKAEADALLKELKRDKKYAKATHNTWALLPSDGEPLKNDDGESGAGMVILRMLERDDIRDTVIVVTRWYGGKHLGGDRFRHVQTCVRAWIDTYAGTTG